MLFSLIICLTLHPDPANLKPILSEGFTPILHGLLGLAQTFGLHGHRRLLGPIVMLLFGLTYLLTPNLTFYNDVLFKYWPFWDLTNTFLLPLLLLFIHLVSAKRSSLHA